jgi:hypothetical protein
VKLDRFFQRRPGLYFVIRLLVFGGGFSLVIWYCLDAGRIPGRHGRSGLDFAKHPTLFSAVIALMVAGTVIAVAMSTLVFLRQKKLLPPDRKPFGIDFRR